MRELPEVPLLAGRRELSAIAERLSLLRERIDRATARRRVYAPPVVLVGAAKRQPVEALQTARDLGLEVFGENRVQEAEAMRRLISGAQWHLIGPLQSNKAKRAIACFDVVQSIDRMKIAIVLDRNAQAAGRTLDCLLQVNLANEATKSGFEQGEVEQLADTLVELANLRVLGLMSIPPRGQVAEDSRPWFRRLRQLRDTLRPHFGWSDENGLLSMGMSSDFEVAIEEGATHVRVGTELFGPRDEPQAREAV